MNEANQTAPQDPEAPSADTAEPSIELRGLSRWYGEVLGVNKVSVDIHPGITGLVGPNGSGKSTIMNVICGLLKPGQGSVRVLGQLVGSTHHIAAHVGYCSQEDSFHENLTGLEFVRSLLGLQGKGKAWAHRTAREALALVDMAENENRRLKTYSKGMRQRVKIALALAHSPQVLVLDEPFNGLDPVGRHEMMELFADYAREGRTLLISSHILHEIEQMTNRVLMMSNGYVVAEGAVQEVRDNLRGHPFQVYVRCDRPRDLAQLLMGHDMVRSVELEPDGGLTFTTPDPDRFCAEMNNVVVDHDFDVDLVAMADENIGAIYRYLLGKERH